MSQHEQVHSDRRAHSGASPDDIREIVCDVRELVSASRDLILVNRALIEEVRHLRNEVSRMTKQGDAVTAAVTDLTAAVNKNKEDVLAAIQQGNSDNQSAIALIEQQLATIAANSDDPAVQAAVETIKAQTAAITQNDTDQVAALQANHEALAAELAKATPPADQSV